MKPRDRYVIIEWKDGFRDTLIEDVTRLEAGEIADIYRANPICKGVRIERKVYVD